ncbi:ABC transporter permease [Ulvibacterium marinum]|uniref:ABC transporter permease n=1 Tax=Ulvibacterium marinum TaxID=2419782 RepID=A0A3B0CDI3_9FLAO|nr:ABC transporter permease [Ulvibacterium marinum]RKN82931.1 ABC transporter permease [Ulvibacterium marinum]
MLKHNLKLFFRNIGKHKSTFLINVVGMSTGLVCALFITLWVLDELSVDRFHEKGDRLVQILQNLPTPNGIETDEATQGPLASALLDEFPEVVQSATVLDNSWFEGEKFLLSDGGNRFFKSVNQFAGKDYFNMFTFPLLYGNPSEVLAHTNSVVISEEMAQKLFKTTDAVGKTLEWLHDEYGGSYTVSGVFKKLPKNSSAQFDAVFNMEVFIAQNEDLRDWRDSDAKTYVLLKPNTDLTAFNTKIKNFLKTRNENFPETYLAQRYYERYLHGNYENGVVAGGRIQYVRLFSLIALLILIIACVNFINMATAKASTRIKEIGVKKSVGAKRKSLMLQFVMESIMMVTVAIVIALFVVKLLLPQFNGISGKELTLSFDPNLILGIVFITLITGIAAGAYPALYLSGLSVLNGLKGQLLKSFGGNFARKGLVIFQFVTSVILIVSVVIVYKQMDFIQDKNLGFNRNNVIWFSSGVMGADTGKAEDVKEMGTTDIENFVQLLRNTPGVVNASNFRHTMMADFGTTTGLDWSGKDTEQDALFAQIAGGYDFIETLQMELKEGRTYSKKFKTEKEKIIFNEAAIAQMGMKDPIGKVINLWGEDREVIGVVKDFHIDRLYKKVLPVFMTLSDTGFASNIMVRMEPGTTTATLGRIKKVYQDYFLSEMPFEFNFLDENYQSLYESERRVAALSKYFAGLAILISCLGLFGLAIFTSERRKKEISIRKVLGQSAAQVTVMLSSEFAKLVLISVLIGLPIAYLLAKNWLSGFAYHIPLQLWYFLGAGIAALAIAMLTVGSQAIRAANNNPVDGLRDE